MAVDSVAIAAIATARNYRRMLPLLKTSKTWWFSAAIFGFVDGGWQFTNCVRSSETNDYQAVFVSPQKTSASNLVVALFA